jgi:chemotaxis protein CheZ
MANAKIFPKRLEALAQKCSNNDPDRVAEMVRSVLGAKGGNLSKTEMVLLAEIEELAQTVAGARAEIAAMGADDITASHIPSATDELDAIVTHTASATDSILESCEQLEAMMVRMSGEDAQMLQDAVTRIYEACSFQDITGQRITKVVAALKAIESKVSHMIFVFAPLRSAGSPPLTEPELAAAPELLNGPQLPTNAMHQSDIDALLASFD